MYSKSVVDMVLARVDEGWNYSVISRKMGVSRPTIRQWVIGNTPGKSPRLSAKAGCPVCVGTFEELPSSAYAYLLGQYLGDGMLSLHPRNVYKLRVACAT